MGYIGVVTHLLTIDPNFQRDIQVHLCSKIWRLPGLYTIAFKCLIFSITSTLFTGGYVILVFGMLRFPRPILFWYPLVKCRKLLPIPSSIENGWDSLELHKKLVMIFFGFSGFGMKQRSIKCRPFWGRSNLIQKNVAGVILRDFPKIIWCILWCHISWPG